MIMDMDSSAELETDDADTHFVEGDPTGRYVRYKKILGRGSFKTVYWAFDKLEGMEVAWNQVKVRDASHGHGDLERLYSEVHLLKTLKHKNIIKFYNYWVDADNNNINIITEIFTSGTLRQYRKRHKQVDVRAIKNWSRQILQGLFYLHSQDPPIIHRDLKCDNIFVNGGQGEVKIGDLGMAAILHQAHADTVIGTPEFMAPELYEEKYNELVDIYSFGMCLLEMMTFEYPYIECENAVQIYKKVSSGVKPAALDKVNNPCVRQFIEKCLTTASKRLSARELLMDPFLQNEGECEIMDNSRLISLGNDFKEGKTILKEPYMNGSLCELSPASEQSLDRGSFKTVEDPKLHSNSNAIMGGSMHQESVEIVNFGSDSYAEAGNSTSSAKEMSQRNRNIRVKGRRKDDNTIFLGLCIADSEGNVCNIHFPFDIEADTAMIVASEMVTELDLSDQDVTKIAELMDVEIASLVPEWKPGVSFDDTSDEYSLVISEDNTSDLTSDDDNSLGGFVVERLPSGRKYWLQSPLPLAGNSASKAASMKAPVEFPGSVHVGFKEGLVTNNLDTRDHFKYPEHSGMIDHTENVLDINTNRDHSPDEIVKSTIVAKLKNHPVSVQVDSNLKERLQDMRRKCLPTNDSKSVNCMNSFEFPSQQGDETTHENHSAVPFLEGTDSVRDPLMETDRRIARELEKLTMKQENELKALKHRHEEALLVLRNQLRQKGCSGRNCFSETSDLQQKLSIDRRSTLKDESKSQRLSLAEITAATATINTIYGLGMHYRSSSGDNCISNHNFGVQALSSRLESVAFSRFDVNVNTQESLPDTVETSNSIVPDVRKEDLSVQGEESKTPSKSQSKRHGIGAIFSKKSSPKTYNNTETTVGKEMENKTKSKDHIKESVKSGSTLGLASKDESNIERVALSKKRTPAKERKQHAVVKSTESSEPSSLADLFKMEESCKLDASAAKKSFKQHTAGLQSELAEIVIDESVPTLANVSNVVEKPGKPEPLIKVYKNGFSRKNKTRSHQRELKASEQSSSKSSPSELPKPKGTTESYQLKKKTSEKSVAPKGKTLELIQKSKNPFNNSVKKQNMTVPLVMAFHL